MSSAIVSVTVCAPASWSAQVISSTQVCSITATIADVPGVNPSPNCRRRASENPGISYPGQKTTDSGANGDGPSTDEPSKPSTPPTTPPVIAPRPPRMSAVSRRCSFPAASRRRSPRWRCRSSAVRLASLRSARAASAPPSSFNAATIICNGVYSIDRSPRAATAVMFRYVRSQTAVLYSMS